MPTYRSTIKLIDQSISQHRLPSTQSQAHHFHPVVFHLLQRVIKGDDPRLTLLGMRLYVRPEIVESVERKRKQILKIQEYNSPLSLSRHRISRYSQYVKVSSMYQLLSFFIYINKHRISRFSLGRRIQYLDIKFCPESRFYMYLLQFISKCLSVGKR